MYVLFVARGYPSEKYRGHGIFEIDQAKALKKSGCKVLYASIDLRSIRRWRKWGFERKRIDGIEIYGMNIPLGRVPESILERAGVWGLEFIYKKILDEHGKPDVIHAHFTGLGYIAAILKKQVNIPLVITEHSSSINKSKIDSKLYRKALIAYENADAVISVSPALSERIESVFGISSICIPNIVDTEIFEYTPKLNNGKFNFVSVGNLIYTKRMDLLIKAFCRSFANNEDVTLTIFGGGRERKNLANIIAECKLQDKIQLTGVCPRSSIAEKFKKSDCFVLPSQSETFGVAYIEALASGLPVIATKCGGPESFINKENGIMINVDDENELIKAMKYMYHHIDKYNRIEIANSTQQRFSPSAVANRIVEVYSEVLSYNIH